MASTVAFQQTPYLESGDRLTRTEFERRYRAMPQLKKAELIEGVVYIVSPLRFAQHAKPHAMIIGWLAVYAAITPGVELADNATLRLDPENEPQPDALLRIDSAKGGQSRVSQDDYLEGAPELIIEIVSSSASYDLHDKLEAYKRNGVCEYVVWRVGDREIDWFGLRKGEYVNLARNHDGVIHSRVFPGLNMPVESLIAGDLQAVLDEAKKGTGSKAHQAFVNELAKR